MTRSGVRRGVTQTIAIAVTLLMVTSMAVALLGPTSASTGAASSVSSGSTAATATTQQYIVTMTSGGQSTTYLETVSNGKVVSMVPTGTTPAASATPSPSSSAPTSSLSSSVLASSLVENRASTAAPAAEAGRGSASAPVTTVPGATASPPPPSDPGIVHVYAETNSTSIQTYPLPQVQEFTPGAGSGTVYISFVSLYLSGSGTASFSVGSVKFGSDVLVNTSVRVAGAGWYNVSFGSVNLNLGSNYYLNVYQTSGTVTWGYTATPTIKINTLTEYYYVGSTFTGSTTTPDLYTVGAVVSPTVYPVTFTETGMPTAAGGGVSFNGGPTTAFTTGGTVVFNAADGT